jgi:hypothetical protein
MMPGDGHRRLGFSHRMEFMEKAWQTYEKLARTLLDRFASDFELDKVEGKQKVQGKRSGTKWEIDAKGSATGERTSSLLNAGGTRLRNSRRRGWQGLLIASSTLAHKGASSLHFKVNNLRKEIDDHLAEKVKYYQHFYFLTPLFSYVLIELGVTLRVTGQLIGKPGEVPEIKLG